MNTSKQIEDNTKVRVRQFMNILEQLPRLCSPTICGTLSQPTTRNERDKATRGGDSFEWSLEQKAILSPANITIDSDGTDEWRHMAELNPSWRQQESETFFSQRTIAPSPLIRTPQTGTIRKKVTASFSQDNNLIYNEDDEDDEDENDEDDDDDDDQNDDDEDEDDDHDHVDDDLEYDDNIQQAQDLTTNHRYNDTTNVEMNYSGKFKSYEFEDDHHVCSDAEFDLGEESHVDDDDGNQIIDAGEEHYNDDDIHETHEELMDDNLFFSPQPLKSSQTQQRMDIFSPNTFVRVMEDENTLQSTPKTTGSLVRTRTRTDVTD